MCGYHAIEWSRPIVTEKNLVIARPADCAIGKDLRGCFLEVGRLLQGVDGLVNY
jgi:hypothetical protein